MSRSAFGQRRVNGLRVASLLAAWMILSTCTVKPMNLSHGDIPEDLPLASGETRLGNKLYADFNRTYTLSEDTGRIAQLTRIVDHLSHAAGAGYAHWQVHLLDAPEVVDVRAVPGNRIFVWSGLYDAILNEDELAGLLACEIAHDLARHTDPVRFNMISSLLFQLGSLAGSTALMIASQGAVNLGAVDWIKLAYIEARDLGPGERHYSQTEERRAASIALMLLQRSDCRPEALVEFYWRTLEERPQAPIFMRLHRRLPPDRRLELLENLIAEGQAGQPAGFPQTEVTPSESVNDRMTFHPGFR